MKSNTHIDMQPNQGNQHDSQNLTHKIVKHTTSTLLALSFLLVVSCDQRKAAIDANNEATKNVIDHKKEAVNAIAKDATKQTEVDAAIDKANIEAEKVAIQAQLDADKKKADADAVAEKAKLDAQQQ